MALSPSDIAKCFPPEVIDSTIATLQAAYLEAAQNKKYALNDMQSNQEVTQQTLDKIGAELQMWIAAKNILSGTAGASLIAAHYTGPN